MSEELGQPFHITEDGGLSLDFHAGQWHAWDSRRRFIFVLAGTQGGKTSFGPHWLHREIYHPQIGCGAGDYLAVTASYDMFKLKMLPAIRELFESITKNGRYWSGDKVIELRDPTPRSEQNPRGGTFWAKRADDPMWGRIILRSAESGSGLESATARAAWLDECGMPSFTAETWRAIRRRLSLGRGRVLGTTTLYALYNWLRRLYDEWRGGRNDVDFVQFASIDNPSFPREEYELALREMPEHVINMQYRGQFDKPPGMIYDKFDASICVVPPFAVPSEWLSCGCMDYGGINTVCLDLRKDPTTGVVYVVREYHEGGRTAQEHAADLRGWGCQMWAGGSRSEGQWRREFRQAGIQVAEPSVHDVWVGINRVYGLTKQNKLMVFDTCQGTLGQLGSYSRPLNKATGEPVADGIMNKDEYHYLDALRYGILRIERGLIQVY